VILDEFDTKREFFQACRRVATAIALRGDLFQTKELLPNGVFQALTFLSNLFIYGDIGLTFLSSVSYCRLGVMIFCFSISIQVPKRNNKTLRVLRGLSSSRLAGGFSGGIRVDEEGRKHGCQDRLHDMPQEAQETAGRQAITSRHVKTSLFSKTCHCSYKQ
jgi:hypothetical protein